MAGHVFPEFDALLARIASDGCYEWSVVEGDFLSVVESFDAEYMQGQRQSGWYQAKARYFNDIIVLLLTRLSSRPIAKRVHKSSVLFGTLDVDICVPATGIPIVAGEVKALGTPPHPRNDMQAREGKADLHKRVREVAFTSMDLKVAYAPATRIGSFQHWIDSTSPGYFSFWAIRTDNERDLETVRTTLCNLRSYCNGVGAILYGPQDRGSPTSYVVRTPRELSIDRQLKEMAQRIVSVRGDSAEEP
jgi:hypothetical protein